MQIRMSARQVTKNVSYIGEFFAALAPLIVRALPLAARVRSSVEGDGLFLKHGADISDGAGLLMGKNNPFKNIPVLGWLL